MSELKIFSSEQFGEVRVIMRDDGPWFIAKDVCECLGLDAASGARGLDEDEKALHIMQSPGGSQEMSIISEPGLYSLILRSRKPEAKVFKRWITHEVIPSIRKTGGYLATKENDTPEAIMARAVIVAQETLKRLEAKNKELVVENNELRMTNDVLEIALGDNRDWKAVTAIPWLRDYFQDTSSSTCARIGKYLTKLSKEMGYEVRKAEDQRWGAVNVYNIIVIDRMKRALDEMPNLLLDLRK